MVNLVDILLQVMTSSGERPAVLHVGLLVLIHQAWRMEAVNAHLRTLDGVFTRSHMMDLMPKRLWIGRRR